MERIPAGLIGSDGRVAVWVKSERKWRRCFPVDAREILRARPEDASLTGDELPPPEPKAPTKAAVMTVREVMGGGTPFPEPPPPRIESASPGSQEDPPATTDPAGRVSTSSRKARAREEEVKQRIGE